jgi:hypothetical protein
VKELNYLEMAKDVLDMWEESMIFHSSFIKQLRNFIKPKLEVAQLSQNQKGGDFMI